MEREPLPSRRLLFVHAHPDDECLSTGGTIARYATDGTHVCLVTCTNGELGEVAEVPELGTVEEITARLAEVRVEELRESCRRLGIEDLRLLGYHDSGMDGEPTNEAPEAFVNQSLDEAAGRIADIIRELRPQVVVTYNEYGFYGHPDHIRAHEATVAAIEMARGDHAVAKLYHTAVPKRRLLEASERLSEEHRRWEADEVDRIGTDDDRITTEIDVGAFVKHKVASIEAHRTQLGTTEWFLSMPAEVRDGFMSTEFYVLAGGTAPKPSSVERDLFEGLDR